MPEELNTVTLGENELRLETLTLPNGNTYILGCSFEEAQEIYQVLSGNIEAINDELEENEEVVAAALTDLDLRTNTLTQDVQDLKDSDDAVTEALEEINGNISNLSENVDGLKEILEKIEITDETAVRSIIEGVGLSY